MDIENTYTSTTDDQKQALHRIELCLQSKSETLDLKNLGLNSIPREIGQLKFLRVLKLTSNNLITLPFEISHLSNLRQLYLGNNKFATLPLHLKNLNSLQELYAFNNQFNKFPSVLSEIPSLEELSLSSNKISFLPPEISLLVNLRKFDLFNNPLAGLPASISKLKSLIELNLSRTELHKLPKFVTEIKTLTTLKLAENSLTSLPQEIKKLNSLQILDLTDNNLSTLPIEITSLPLSQLYLHDNPGLTLPDEVLGPTQSETPRRKPASPSAILDYFFALLEQGKAPIQEVRLLLVGRGRVGKTSLLNALREKDINLEEQETPGITVLPIDLPCAKGIARAHVWDFGGQEFLHGTHQIFLSERCVYVLVLEGRESNWENETDYWLRFIQSFGGESPVIVVLNKYDSHAFSVDEFRLRERCPQIINFIKTDALTKLGIAKLRNLIAETVDQMPHVWEFVPKKWHLIKEELAKSTKSFFDYKEYQALCISKGVNEPQQQDSLAQNLHRLGIALNFRDHQRLKHTSVLKPQWVTEGIYGLLRFSQKQDCHGIFNENSLTSALPEHVYPREKHEFVMDLMEKFEVAFAIRSDNEKNHSVQKNKSQHESNQPQSTKKNHFLPRVIPLSSIGSHVKFLEDDANDKRIFDKLQKSTHLNSIVTASNIQKYWLIPELLPEVQPAAFIEFSVPDVQKLRFTYPEALPPGLLPRFITRTHEMSSKHPEWRWRSGVVLEWNSSQALVRLDRSQRRTDVAVINGTIEQRQNLFDIIRSHLVELHGNVKSIEEVPVKGYPEKWVELNELRMAERENDPTLKITVGQAPNGKRIGMPVVETLNEVESEDARKALGPDAEMRMRLFISYAHKNEKELESLRQHLTLLSQQGYIQVWHDRDLIAGELWEKGIMESLEEADIILLFYTTAARVSNFIQKKELPIALDRSDKGMCTLIWIPLERSDLDQNHRLEQRLSKLQCGTTDAKPIYEFHRLEMGWLEVENSVRSAVKLRRELRDKQK